ncbi:unnamed protein product [marine sediment metagenome]|uniref:Uncharacterized protein n=1 Tax=marine sediment metagenome TaxID=412755 RepID=X1HBV7_9ZZZZ
MQLNCLLYVKDDGVRKMIELYHRIMIHDPEGNLVKDTGKVKSHSYVIQFLELVEGLFKGANKTATDVAGAETRIIDLDTQMQLLGRADAPVNDAAYGIVVGTNAGVSAEDNEDYALDSKIADGGGAGQLQYQAMVFWAPAVDGANVDYDMARPFGNDSGNTITVKEIGLICKNADSTFYHLLLRDVVSDEDVLDGYTLTVTYTLRTTV